MTSQPWTKLIFDLQFMEFATDQLSILVQIKIALLIERVGDAVEGSQ